MASNTGSPGSSSPWRALFEEVRRAVGSQRDELGVVGSINWLRAQMERRGANPNVVRNIIYRDKGRLPDKRTLFEILDELWRNAGNPPLRSPELEAALAPGNGNDHEVLQLLGREKRRAYRSFVQGVRSGGAPRLIVTGRPGAGKTLLVDFIQQALELDPPAADRIIRVEFSGTDLATALAHLAMTLGAPRELIESRLVKIGTSSAFAVQADAQAEVARALLDAARCFDGSQVLMLHVAQSIGGQDSLGLAPLRLNTPEVPRVSAAEWLWVSLFEPLARLPRTALLVSMADLPARALQHAVGFDPPFRLTPPTMNEARRFVRARLPGGSPAQHEDIVQRAGKSFEELRTLTLLAELREAGASDGPALTERAMAQLAQLVATASDARLRSFLGVVATLSLPELPAFDGDILRALLGPEATLTNLEEAFLDPVPGRDAYRCFSRQVARGLSERLLGASPERYRELHRAAAAAYAAGAALAPAGEVATRYLSHLFEARDWSTLAEWMACHGTQQSLVRRIWQAATQELAEGAALEPLARQVASHYVALGSFNHRDARDAFSVLASSADLDTRVWTALQRAEGLTLRGHYDQAEAMLATLPPADSPILAAESALARAAIARWRGRSSEATRLVREDVALALGRADDGYETTALRARAALWEGVIAKDRGDLRGALGAFERVTPYDDLLHARVAFQRGDVFMRLGHFARALGALDVAVERARRSDALLGEQTRYLSRRGTVHRRRGDLDRAEADFAEARRVLVSGLEHPSRAGDLEEGEHSFWLARVDDEAGLNLLAQRRFDEAILTFERNIGRFARFAAAQGIDDTYRVLRSTLRLALAYGCRGARQPFRRPFSLDPALQGSDPDLRHARALLQHVVERIERAGAERLATLHRDALLAASLFTADRHAALDLSDRALDISGYPYQRAQTHAHAAFAALRFGEAERADHHVAAASEALRETLDDAPEEEGGDLEMAAWLVGLAAMVALARGDGRTAGSHIAAGLLRSELEPHWEILVHHFGDAAERAGLVEDVLASELAALLELRRSTVFHPLRFADLLVARLHHLPASVMTAAVVTLAAATEPAAVGAG
jgi:tetratricopeptide (TPR) repeat protein